MCPLTVHGLLHIPDDIVQSGPCCYNWSFLVERWCGSLAPAIKSKVKPFVCLAMRQLHLAQLNIIQARYNLGKTFSVNSRTVNVKAPFDECERATP